MMSDADIDAIEDIIQTLKPATVLEWGSGNSTSFFSKAECVRRWVAVEHNGNYVRHLSAHVDPEKVTLIWAPEDEWYVDCVKLNVGQFDLILVDGIDAKRGDCLEAAFDLLRPGGIVLLHDSSRREYAPFIAKYADRRKLTEGEVPQGDGFFAHRGLTAFYSRRPAV